MSVSSVRSDVSGLSARSGCLMGSSKKVGQDCRSCKKTLCVHDHHEDCIECLGVSHDMPSCIHCQALPIRYRRDRAQKLIWWAENRYRTCPSSSVMKAVLARKPRPECLMFDAVEAFWSPDVGSDVEDGICLEANDAESFSTGPPVLQRQDVGSVDVPVPSKPEEDVNTQFVQLLDKYEKRAIDLSLIHI